MILTKLPQNFLKNDIFIGMSKIVNRNTYRLKKLLSCLEDYFFTYVLSFNKFKIA